MVRLARTTLLFALPLLFAACKSQPVPIFRSEGQLVAEGPAREVIVPPRGDALAWLANPQLAREKGVNASDQVLVGAATLAPSAGGRPVELGGGVATLPGTFFFSPSGGWLGAITRWNFQQRHGVLVVADARQGTMRQVAEKVSFFAFTADDRRLGYVADGQLFVQEAAGGDPRPIADEVSTFEFSPDGSRIAVRRRFLQGNGELLLVDLAGGEKPSTRTLASQVAEYAWSPKGDRLAFTARNETGGTDLFVVVPGRPARHVGTGVALFRFSPGGEHVAFVGDVSPKKQFGDLYVLPAGAEKAIRIGTSATEFAFDPTGRRIAWLDKFNPQSRGGILTWAEVGSTESNTVAPHVPSFVWSNRGDMLAFVRRVLDPVFSIDLFLARLGSDPVKVGQGVFGYSFTGDDERLFFRTSCTRNARSCDLHAIRTAAPTEPAQLLANGIFTYELDPGDESIVMITYARTDADAINIAVVPADGSLPPKTLNRMVARGTKFLPGEGDRMAWAVIDPQRLGVYVSRPPYFDEPTATK